MKAIKVTVDILLEDAGKILLVKRAYPPFKGKWALPGGYIEYGETAEKAAIREAKEETGLDVGLQGIICRNRIAGGGCDEYRGDCVMAMVPFRV